MKDCWKLPALFISCEVWSVMWCVYVHAHTCRCAYMCTCRGQRLMSGAFLYRFPPYFWGGSLPEPGVCWFGLCCVASRAQGPLGTSLLCVVTSGVCHTTLHCFLTQVLEREHGSSWLHGRHCLLSHLSSPMTRSFLSLPVIAGQRWKPFPSRLSFFPSQ